LMAYTILEKKAICIHFKRVHNPPALAFATSCGSCSKRCALLAFIAPLVSFQILALL